MAGPFDNLQMPVVEGVEGTGEQADLAVMESSAAIPLSTGWVVTKERRYGGTLITVVQRTNSES